MKQQISLFCRFVLQAMHIYWITYKIANILNFLVNGLASLWLHSGILCRKCKIVYGMHLLNIKSSKSISFICLMEIMWKIYHCCVNVHVSTSTNITSTWSAVKLCNLFLVLWIAAIAFFALRFDYVHNLYR